ncbi:peptide chain release factor N(5)-glutamine methyltransferase [Paenisporosarcina cavernae]|uniref:Release factor glutamine methyltransferase n=1 Tax=Paenisporosarcina cavernae TaxID=2320858 RepID=A0A385YT09_9BACL|nr:peptide chain release factor N(5)-glutamine methyltransferase [Paenisporosarcina cavernae]AYC28818.1 peptide chain release factor N(5)-glutamine methyltransferase [Paenisporosarcina cavernae]
MSKAIYEALSWASSYLTEKNREPRAAQLLLQHVTSKSHAALIADAHEQLKADEWAQFEHFIHQHGKGIPIQYLIGEEEFYGRHFTVNPSVLIPRPETEELIELVLTRATAVFGNETSLRVADIGTGSGIIGITVKLERPNWNVTVTDIDSDALHVALANAARLEAEVTGKIGDGVKALLDSSGKLDIVVSNPPYIADSEAADMSEVVLDHEPHLALFADNKGLAIYQQLCRDLPSVMKSPGIVAFEIGYLQGKSVQQLLQNAFPSAIVEVHKDINGKDRMVIATV